MHIHCEQIKRTEPTGDSFMPGRDASARICTFLGFLLQPGARLLPPRGDGGWHDDIVPLCFDIHRDTMSSPTWNLSL